MGAAYSTEEALDLVAADYIEGQTRADLDLLQSPEYCNELLGVVADLLEAVAWPPEFDFKGRIFNPTKRTFLVLAKYYIKVAQMFGATVRCRFARPLVCVRPLFDTVFDPAAQTYSAPPAGLAAYRDVVSAISMALDGPAVASEAEVKVVASDHSPFDGCTPLRLAYNYGAVLGRRQALVGEFNIGFPQIGDLERTMADIKEEIQRTAARTKQIDEELQYREEVFVERLRFDLISQRIEYLENL